MAMPRFNLGGALIEGLQAGQADAMRRQQMKLAEEQAAFERSLRPIRQAEAQYGLRGQILGTVETPEDYAAALGEVSRLNLPTGDLPENKQSTAWMTFKAPEAAPQIMPSWMPQSWDIGQTLENRIDLPAPQSRLPGQNLSKPGIAPEEIATTVQRRAQIGLPLNVQQRFQDADLGRQIQREELAKRSEKYKTQIDYAERAADRADKRFALQETQDERKARLEREKMDLERERMDIARREANAKTERETPKISGYEPIPGQTVDASSAKVARDAIAKLGSLESITKEFREAYNAAKKRGVGGQIVGPDADRLNGIRQRMLLNLKEAENLGVLQAVDIQTMEPIVPKAVGPGALFNAMIGRNDPMIALDQFEREVKGRLGSVVQSHGYRPIAKAGQDSPTASPYKFTRTYQGATYGRNSDGENWKLVK